MRFGSILLATLIATPAAMSAQGLREVPQRFAYVQPIGLALGVANAGLEFAIGPRTSVEIGGVGVYSVEDGVKIFGGGPGIGLRRYFGEGELAGVVVGGQARRHLVNRGQLGRGCSVHPGRWIRIPEFGLLPGYWRHGRVPLGVAIRVFPRTHDRL